MFMGLQKIDRNSVFTRLLTVLEQQNIKVSDYQKKHKISSQVWNNWINRGLPSDYIVAIANDLQLSVDWFAHGIEQKIKENKFELYAQTENEKAALTIARSLPHEVQTLWLADGYKMLQVATATLKTKDQSDEDDKK